MSGYPWFSPLALLCPINGSYIHRFFLQVFPVFVQLTVSCTLFAQSPCRSKALNCHDSNLAARQTQRVDVFDQNLPHVRNSKSRSTFTCVSGLPRSRFLCSRRPTSASSNSGRLTSGSRPGQAVPSPFCQRSKDEGKLRPKFTKCEKINISEHGAGFRPPVAMAKPKWRQILLSLTVFSNVTSKEGKPMSCACSVFIPVKRMGVCNFSPMG